MKSNLLALLLALITATPIGLAAPAEEPKKSGKPPEFFAARRVALAARKEAQRERVRQFKVDRAAAQEKLYQDWHDRYVADAPIREAYYRTQESAYQAQAAYLYAAGPPTIIQMNQSVGGTGSTFGYTGSSFTPSCSTSRSAFFVANDLGRRLMNPATIQIPVIQP